VGSSCQCKIVPVLDRLRIQWSFPSRETSVPAGTGPSLNVTHGSSTQSPGSRPAGLGKEAPARRPQGEAMKGRLRVTHLGGVGEEGAGRVWRDRCRPRSL
jgi:hypothetical protein